MGTEKVNEPDRPPRLMQSRHPMSPRMLRVLGDMALENRRDWQAPTNSQVFVMQKQMVN